MNFFTNFTENNNSRMVQEFEGIFWKFRKKFEGSKQFKKTCKIIVDSKNVHEFEKVPEHEK